MSTYSNDRRSLLKIFGAIGATCAYPFASDELHGQTAAHLHNPAPLPGDGPLRFFNPDDFAVISRIADLIIPPTETPGAVGAGVPAYVDLVIARSTDQQLLVADGLRWLDVESQRISGSPFIHGTERQQLSILEPLCEAADTPTTAPRGRNVQFFSLLKGLVADGYYTSRVGLIDELGYKGNTVVPVYPACPPKPA